MPEFAGWFTEIEHHLQDRVRQERERRTVSPRRGREIEHQRISASDQDGDQKQPGILKDDSAEAIDGNEIHAAQQHAGQAQGKLGVAEALRGRAHHYSEEKAWVGVAVRGNVENATDRAINEVLKPQRLVVNKGLRGRAIETQRKQAA